MDWQSIERKWLDMASRLQASPRQTPERDIAAGRGVTVRHAPHSQPAAPSDASRGVVRGETSVST